MPSKVDEVRLRMDRVRLGVVSAFRAIKSPVVVSAAGEGG